MIASEFETYETIRSQRKDAGGLICTTVPSKTWEKLGIPFLSDILKRLLSLILFSRPFCRTM